MSNEKPITTQEKLVVAIARVSIAILDLLFLKLAIGERLIFLLSSGKIIFFPTLKKERHSADMLTDVWARSTRIGDSLSAGSA